MRTKKRTRPAKRVGAALLSLAVLWGVFAAVGSDTPAEAIQAVEARGTARVALLRAQLGDSRPTSTSLPLPVALVISQSPLLLSTRQAMLALRARVEEDREETEPLPPDRILQETPAVPEPSDPPPAFADNGVPARMLVPTSAEGYLVTGLAYITNSSDREIDAALFEEDLTVALSGEEPQVLIVHTHGSEAYTMPPGEEYIPSGESRTTDTACNVVRVGDEIAAELARFGISVIHDRSMYDYPRYNGAYDRSLEAVEAYLEKYPSVTVVLDVHRDAVADSDGTPYKVVSPTAEGTAAQLSLVVGTDGSGLAHENWRENLKLAAALQNTLMETDPTLMRPIVVRNSRYNQHCCAGSLLVEVGAAGNSLDEALLSARLLARGLARTLGAELRI